jgi:phosphate-selective porin
VLKNVRRSTIHRSAALLALLSSVMALAAPEPELKKLQAAEPLPNQAALLPRRTGKNPQRGEAAVLAARPKRVEADIGGSLDWRGWQGWHYEGYVRHRHDWKWTDDDKEPSFPSIFLDRLSIQGKFGARVDLDAAAFAPADGLGPVANGVQVRRWRIYTSGEAIAVIPFAYTFSVVAVANNHFVLDDTFLEFKRIPYVGTFKIGAFIPRMGLENSASSREATFMEWSSAVEALGSRISLGGQFSRPVFHERATWSLGFLTESLGTDVGDATKDFVRVIGRATWLPFYEAPDPTSGSPRLLHVGLNANFLHSGNATIRYQTRPESRMAPFLADTGAINAKDMGSYGLEVAWLEGPWSFQGEYLSNHITDVTRQNFYGFYAYGSYFLTGESRHYDPTTGYFTRLKPRQDFSFGGSGLGAVEAALRFSYVDLSDGPVKGGILRSLTAGINWYLHANSKVRFNYVFASASGGPQSGDLNIFETRFEFDF